MSRLSLRILAKTLLRIDLGRNEDTILQALTSIMDPAHGGPFRRGIYRLLPAVARAHRRRALSAFENVVSWVIENRSGEASLMSRFVPDAAEPIGACASSRFRDEVATFLLAGQETSALGLTWTLHLLSRHPEIEQKTRAEIAQVLNHRSPSTTDLRQLTFTGQVIHEALRLYPPIPAFVRQAVEDDVIAGYTIRANTIVRIKTSVLHRRADFWKDPERFWPDRFGAEQAAAQPPWTYLPFGAGGRSCLGSNFAMMEMKSAVAMILQAARLKPAQKRPVEVESSVTLRPRYGVWMIPEFASAPL